MSGDYPKKAVAKEQGFKHLSLNPLPLNESSLRNFEAKKSAPSGEGDDRTAPGKCPDTGVQLQTVLGSAGSGEPDGMTAPGKCPETGAQLQKRLGSAGSGEPDGVTAPGKFPETCVQLKRALGLGNGVGFIVGYVIGSGIFVSPKTVVEYTGSVGMALVVWVVSGLVTVVDGLCFAELGTTIPRSGDSYSYILEAFGPIPAFIELWTSILISSPSAKAISSLTFASYLLQALLPDCSSPPYYAVKLLAAAMICIIAYVNCFGIKLGTRVQDTLAMTKVLALIIIIVGGVHHLARGHVEHYLDPMKGTVWDVSSFATAFYSTLYAYSGIGSLNAIIGELKDPYKNLPRAIAISLSIVTTVYILTNVAYYAVLTPAEILSSNAVAVTFGSKLVGWLGWLMAFFVACSVVGTTNAGMLSISRRFFIASQEGHLPEFLGLISVNHSTPIIAVVSSVVIPILMLTVDNVGSLVNYFSIIGIIGKLTAVLGLLWLRYKEPDRPRPIKVWLGIPIMSVVVNIFLLTFPLIRRPVEIAVALAVMTSGLVVYFFTIHRDTKSGFLAKIKGKMTFMCQVIFLCSPEDKSE
nr:Y+L amino acid transporter 2-like [Procambarus clarkii]